LRQKLGLRCVALIVVFHASLLKSVLNPFVEWFEQKFSIVFGGVA
jgi:hypothetical protein